MLTTPIRQKLCILKKWLAIKEKFSNNAPGKKIHNILLNDQRNLKRKWQLRECRILTTAEKCEAEEKFAKFMFSTQSYINH
jgi:hypothetical protein